MFTGLIEEIGTIVEVSRGRGLSLCIKAERVLDDLSRGDSIAVSGPCLTVEKLDRGCFWASLLPETAAQTTLGSVRRNHRVNLERPMRVGDRLGGHLVSGHVDGIGTVLSVEERGETKSLRLECPAGVERYLVDLGSVSVEGASLTVREPVGRAFGVSLVGTTLEATTLGSLRPGDRVNIESDLMAKHIERLLAAQKGEGDSEKLLSWLSESELEL